MNALADTLAKVPQGFMQNLLMALMLAALVWGGNSLVELKEDVAVLKQQITTATDDRYRGKDAERDQALLQHHLDVHENRINDNTWRIEKLEQK